MLVVLTGLPGTGKSAVADALGVALPAAVFARDRIEAGLWAGGLSAQLGSGRAAYHVMTALAADQLAVGQRVVLDSVATTETIRDPWRRAAAHHAAPMRVIECICSDERLHRSRIEQRRRDIRGWYEASWSDVQHARTRYEPWPREVESSGHLVLDAVNSLSANVATPLAFTRT